MAPTTTTSVPSSCIPPSGVVSRLLYSLGAALRIPSLQQVAVLLCGMGL